MITLGWAAMGRLNASGYDKTFPDDGNVLELQGGDDCTIIHLIKIIAFYIYNGCIFIKCQLDLNIAIKNTNFLKWHKYITFKVSYMNT